MIRQVELVERVLAYDPAANEDLLNRAYVFAMKAHGAQIRASGDPYFSHPLEVAGVLTDYKLDAATIVTALLHDTIEDTVATYEELEAQFGSQIAKLVDGVTKLSKLELQSNRTRQAENFRKLLLAMSDDIRVLLVKLADRLHNMRTLHHIDKSDKRQRIARETMEIYAPLAERIGMHEIKDELEDLAFAELNGEARASILKRLEFLRQAGSDLVDRIVVELESTLRSADIHAKIFGRQKRPYSIWRKMELKSIAFEQLSDVIGFRIILDDLADCYRVLGVVHAAYPMVPGTFKDYISTPKRNNYRSLHTQVIGPERQRIEIQIRTRHMHDLAEYGVAAHWSYKQEIGDANRASMQYRWLRELLEILENDADADEFLEHTKLNMFQDQVFCFSPKGDLIALPSGATTVDFAYAVHTELGNACIAAKVNGRVVPLRTVLRNGDQVEIQQSKNQTPSPTWETFVVTGKARSAIRRFVRQQRRSQYVELGRQILDNAFQADGHELSEKALADVLKALKQKTDEDLYDAVGSGLLTSRQVVEAAFPPKTLKAAIGKIVPLARSRGERRQANRQAVSIRGLIPGMALHFAGCCHPLPGDRIVGIVTSGKGVTVHTIDCESLEQFADTPERWVDVSWQVVNDNPEFHVGRINTVVANQPGALSSLTTVIAKNMGNISNLKITNRSTDFFEMTVDIEVRDLTHLTSIVAALRAEPAISSVDRARS